MTHDIPVTPVVEGPASAAVAPPLRTLHPLTPLLGSWRALGAFTAAALGLFRDDFDKLAWIWQALHGDAELGVLVKALGVFSVFTLISVTMGWLSWRVTGFAIVTDSSGGETLLFHRGLVVRQRSQVRLKRVQSVDVNSPFLPRLLGLSALRLEMAAGEGASVNLAYLRNSEAWELREEILRYTSVGASHSAQRPRADLTAPRSGHGGSSAGLPAGAAGSIETPDDTLIARVSTTQLIKANLLDGMAGWVLLIGWLVALGVSGALWGTAVLLAALGGIVPVTIAFAVQTSGQVKSILGDADFRLYRTASGVRLRSGLTSTVNRTIDFDRIQSVRLVEPYLWRRFGWAAVKVDIAGALGDGDKGAALMPVADRATALSLIADITGVHIDNPRYLSAGAGARALDPLAGRSLGVALFDVGAVSRRGRWRRSSAFVPYARVQSVSATQGWLQRRLTLATVYVDLPVGAQRWDARHRELGDAVDLVHALTTRARLATAGERLQPALNSADSGANHDPQQHTPQQFRPSLEHWPRQDGQPADEPNDHHESRQREDEGSHQADQHQPEHQTRDDELRQPRQPD